MAVMTLTEAFAEIEALERLLTVKRAFVVALTVRPANLRDPLASAGGTAVIVAQQQASLAALEERHIALRRAVRVVAQSATLTLGSETRTVADWLEWRRKVAYERRTFLNSLRAQILVGRQQAHVANLYLAQSEASGRPVDVVVNTNEQDLARQSELLEEVIGGLDGQLSLKSATLTIDIPPLSQSLTEHEALLNAWMVQMNQEALAESRTNRSRTPTQERSEPLGGDARYAHSVLSTELQGKVHGLLSQGLKLEAIKMVRAETGWSLLWAKQAVDALG